MKMLITLEQHGIFCSIFVYYCILTFPTAGMRTGDEASPSIILAGRALLVKMLITLETCGIFWFKLYIQMYSNSMQNGEEASPSIIMAG